MTNHTLVPEHKKLDKEESEKVLKKYNISKKQLPKIKSDDISIEKFQCEIDDIIEITRKSQIYGDLKFYRLVVR